MDAKLRLHFIVIKHQCCYILYLGYRCFDLDNHIIRHINNVTVVNTMSYIRVYKYSNSYTQYHLSISTHNFTQTHGYPFGYEFIVHDGYLGDAHGLCRIPAEDHHLIADFMYAIKIFCRDKGVMIRIKYKKEKYFDDYVSYYFPEFYYGNLHKRILNHLERWSDLRIRTVLKRWHMIVRKRKWHRIYNIMCLTPIPNDCVYTIVEKVFHQP